MQLKPNTPLKGGEFRIIKFLGHGGFGMTYLAEQISLNNRKVCIKEFFPRDYYRREDDAHRAVAISENFAKDMEVYKQKFYKEATTIASFNHNNIVKIYDVFHENDTVYYAMEYIDGCSLRDMIADKRPLSKGRALKYVRETAKALAHIHKQGCVHLDIKPANIMVREDDDSVVVIDFGLSKHFNEDGTPTSTTPGGFSRGYTPLEMYQTQKERKFLPPTDIYSLGATLYALLTGEEPVEASDISLYGVPKHDRLDATMYAFISHAMSPNPDNRPQSIEEFTKLLGAKSKAETDNGDTVLEKSGNVTKKEKPANSKPTIELNIKKAVNSHFNEATKCGITINNNLSKKVVTKIYLNNKKCFKLKSVSNMVGVYRVYGNNFELNKALAHKIREGYTLLPGKYHAIGNDTIIKKLIGELVATGNAKISYNTRVKPRGVLAFLYILLVVFVGLMCGSVGIWGLWDCSYIDVTTGVLLQIALVIICLIIVSRICRGKLVDKG